MTGYILTHHLDHEGSLGRNIAAGSENLAQVVEESESIRTQLGIVWPDRKELLRRVCWGRRYKNSNVVGVMHTGTSSGSQVSIDLGVFSDRGGVRIGLANPHIDGRTVLDRAL